MSQRERLDELFGEVAEEVARQQPESLVERMRTALMDEPLSPAILAARCGADVATVLTVVTELPFAFTWLGDKLGVVV